MKEVNEVLGGQIREYIIGNGMKLTAVAEKTGIPMNTFSAMMNGKRRITAEEYFAICSVLNVPLETFAIQA